MPCHPSGKAGLGRDTCGVLRPRSLGLPTCEPVPASLSPRHRLCRESLPRAPSLRMVLQLRLTWQWAGSRRPLGRAGEAGSLLLFCREPGPWAPGSCLHARCHAASLASAASPLVRLWSRGHVQALLGPLTCVSLGFWWPSGNGEACAGICPAQGANWVSQAASPLPCAGRCHLHPDGVCSVS